MSNQQIYLPLEDRYPIPYKFEADTMQVPRGQFSVLWELRDGNLTAAEALIYLCLNHGSTWNSGKTWGMSSPYLSKILGVGMSRRHVRGTLASLKDKGWIKTINHNNPAGNQYRLRHHLCGSADVPVNKNGKPLKLAVPRGAGGPLERCFEGDISWKAALVWIVLKFRSNWKAHEETAGQTEKATLLELSKRCRIGNANFQKAITELTQAGMLERLSPKSQPAIFQLYPKPFPKSTASKPKIRQEWVKGKAVRTDDEHWYSNNGQYRCPMEDYFAIERRQRGGTWKRISDYHKSQVMPRAILEDFERAVSVHCSIKRALETSEKVSYEDNRDRSRSSLFLFGN